jgi:hypothetical protein
MGITEMEKKKEIQGSCVSEDYIFPIGDTM